MKLSCIIIDDEPLARKGLREYIQDVDFLQLEGEFDNPLKATDVLSNRQVDLMFLDIHMPKITGIEFLRTLQHPPQVILTTAFPQYAVDGFDLNVLDYLVKPISFDRFLKAVMKAKETLSKKGGAVQTAEDFVFIKADNKLVKIFYHDILFIEALQNYVTIHTLNKKYVTYLTFKSMEESLPSDQFIRVHKSYLVSANKIESIEGNCIRIAHHEIPISRTVKEEVLEKLLRGRFLKR
ncbi:MAG TPA: LytTR family DNA-binding domain-containing protein [Chitinophagaceae bacterium]|nr:LytTR family DNA-binding domain-containing protein [Chitinophagaceae bacterium]